MNSLCPKEAQFRLANLRGVSLMYLTILLSPIVSIAQPTIATQPTGQVINCEGGTITYSVEAVPEPNLVFVWRYQADTSLPSQSANLLGNILTIDSVSSFTIPVLGTNHSGWYFVCVIGNLGSVCSDTLQLVVLPKPMANAGNNMALNCIEMEVELNGSSSTQDTSITYTWQDEAGMVLGNDLNQSVSEPGEYTLTVSNSCGEDVDMVTVTAESEIPLNLNITANHPALSCQTPQVVLIATTSTPDATGVWNGPGINNQPGFVTAISIPGTYVFTAKHPESHCTDSISYVVEQDLSDYPSADITPPGKLTCVVSLVELIASNFQNASIFNWYNPNNMIIGGATAAASTPGIYQFKMSNNNCQQIYDVVVVQDIEPPTIEFDPENATICEGETLILTASGGDIYQWEGSTVNGPMIEITEPDTYKVTVTNSGNGCKASASISVSQRPKPVFLNSFMDESIKDGELLEIQVSISPSSAIGFWQIVETINLNFQGSSEGEGTFEKNFSLADDRSLGTAAISFYSDNLGCPGDTFQIHVEVLPESEDVFIPDVFTPNGDGTNDYWAIIPADGVELEKITIFNSLGGTVVEISAPQEWDAAGCPDGTYYYVAIFTGIQSNGKIVKKGAVTILRTSN